MNPLDWSGPDFLILFGVLIGVAALATVVLHRVLRPDGYLSPTRKLHPCELGCLASGPSRATISAALSLCDKNLAEFTRSGALLGRAPARGRLSLLEQTVFSNADRPGVYMPEMRRRCANALKVVQETLTQEGLLVDSGYRSLMVLISLVIFGLVAALGVAKVFVGFERDKPVVFLIIGLVLLVIVFFVICSMIPRQTRAGRRAVKDVKDGGGVSTVAAVQRRDEPTWLDPMVPTLFAVTGAASLVGTSYEELKSKLNAADRTTGGDGGGSGSGWSGGDCGGGGGDSGCAGDGCGGGCGGCGGD